MAILEISRTAQTVWVVGLVIVAAGSVRVLASEAFRQTPQQVVTREPGQRFLGSPTPIRPEAIKDLDFAWLSVQSYQRLPQNSSRPPDGCPASAEVLRLLGWEKWVGFPDSNPDLMKHLNGSNLRLDVWSNATTHSVAIAFGGTIATSWPDWKSNLRWILPIRNDEYSRIVKFLGPAFVEEFKRRAAEPEGAYLRNATLYSTGHSLGGGLAQQFAYALPRDPAVPRVSHIYAFDTTPVTGWSSVEKELREYNAEGLAIDRIYQRGEILAYLRSITNFVAKPRSVNPAIRQVRYNLVGARGPVANHSIPQLACDLYKVTR